jgi:hypothetical protein
MAEGHPFSPYVKVFAKAMPAPLTPLSEDQP